ncbi:glycosyltransferase family 4 protein [Flavihumibacter rivuli]|uniref:glycosyltransferase family 4 protein n=1 Tax=Flavihumibacter rivuli TaxID=2838156 RepID=UPI001BDEC70E|nr:glycosyltransferase family 4 protein [Flavihumibacter rivuli]ULQ56262.1 glycosyltransferase family 4 protein [Flavihumibacter rivuli]
MSNLSISYFISHPIQYFAPLFKALAREVDLKVYYFSDASIKGDLDKEFGTKIKWDIPLLEGYASEFLPNYAGSGSLDNHLFDVFNPGVISRIMKDGRDIVIVNGWSYSSTLLAIVAGKLAGKQVWLRAESPLNQELRKASWKLTLKKTFLKYFLFKPFIDKFLYIGSQNKAFYQYFGVPEHRLIFTPYAVDNDFFQAAHVSMKGKEEEIKRQLQLPAGKKVLLFSGKYIEKKRPMDLLKAFHLLNRDDLALVFVGEGELRRQMEQYIREYHLNNVFLTGFVNQLDIPRYYQVADIFIMCSGIGETWGLSVNEAMNFEKPVIVSRTCGSSYDLVKDGVNGYTVEEGDVDGLADAIRKIIEVEGFAEKAGKASGEIIRDFSIGQIVAQIANNVKKG